MRIDIIVPNFDDSSDDVVLSTWYKKVGDKILKNEIIADAETAQIACGITSSYDCILAKILVKEGETISQGTKIAVIETDLAADKDIKQLSEIEEIKAESAAIDEAVKRDAEKEIAANLEIDNEETTNYESSRINEEIIENINDEIIAIEVENERKPYSFTASDDETSKQGKNSYVFNVIEADKVVEEVELATELSAELIEEKIIDDFTEKSEEKVATIIKRAEGQAKEEAHKIKKQIIEDAKRQALQQAEETKERIIKKYEEKAIKDASEMHQKIVQGSISEAESTKAKLLGEAKEKAQKEAEELRASILKDAESLAKQKAKEIEKEATVKAKLMSEEISKKIIEDSIKEAKQESKSIKKDILRSANKYANKESINIIRKSIKNARTESEMRSKTIMQSTLAAAAKEVELMQDEILKNSSEEIKNIVNKAIEDISKQINYDLKNGIDTSVHNITSSIHHEMKEEVSFALKKLVSQINNEIKDCVLSIMKEINYETNHKVKNSIMNMAEDIIIKENESIKNDMSSLVKEMSENINEELKESIHSMLKKTVKKEKKEIKNDLNSLMQDFSSDIQKEVQEKVESIKTPVNSGYEIRYSLEPRPYYSESEISTLANKVVEEEVNNLKEKEFANMLINNHETSPDMHADSWNKPKFFASPEDESVPIDFLKQRINEKLKSSLESSVISTVSNEVDMTAVLSLEKTFGEAFSKKYNTRLGFTPFFILGSISALKEHRVFNAHIRENDIIYKNTFDISIITCGNDGVIAPVIRHADTLSISEIEKAMITLSRRAIENTLSVEEVSGGTFTVVNAGIYGSLMGTDLLTPPQVATLSVHRMHNRPIATDTGVEIKPMLYISLSYDHRIADTKQASEFLLKVKHYVENPGWTLLGL